MLVISLPCTLSSFVHPLKKALGIAVIFSDNVTVFRFVQPKNAPYPEDISILSGKVIEVKPAQPLNA